tara:strand:+ start:642 stop:836 length:195 start_codon:yes stop_codon:yes gene_type:complete
VPFTGIISAAGRFNLNIIFLYNKPARYKVKKRVYLLCFLTRGAPATALCFVFFCRWLPCEKFNL